MLQDLKVVEPNKAKAMIRVLRFHGDGVATDRVDSFFAKYSDLNKDAILGHVDTVAGNDDDDWTNFIFELEKSLRTPSPSPAGTSTQQPTLGQPAIPSSNSDDSSLSSKDSDKKAADVTVEPREELLACLLERSAVTTADQEDESAISFTDFRKQLDHGTAGSDEKEEWSTEGKTGGPDPFTLHADLSAIIVEGDAAEAAVTNDAT